MSADKFMVELFRTELASQGAKLSESLKPPYESGSVLEALSSLRSSATMLGFDTLVALFSKLERYFAHADSKRAVDPAAARIIDFVLSLASDTPDALLEKIEANSELAKELGLVELNEPELLGEGAGSGVMKCASADSRKDDGGKIRPKIDEAMKPLFLQEAENRLSALESGLVELERDFQNFSKIEALMRASHSLKGAARVVGLDCIVKLTHQMENCFVAAQDRKITLSSADIDVFFDCVDYLKNLVALSFAEIDLKVLDGIYNELLAVESGSPKSQRAASRVASPEYSPHGSPGDSTVKISAKNLNSMMELAAESLIENRRIENFRELLVEVKSSLEQVARQFEDALNSIEASEAGEYSLSRLEQLRKSVHGGIGKLRSLIGNFSEFSRRNVTLSGKLYSEVLVGRMRPFSDGVQAFNRMVRDLAKDASKRIVLEIEGSDVPVDRDVLEKLEAPITQILKNSCDHGIEPPDERLSKGKPELGTIKIKAWHSAGLLMLEISDDGRGFDEEKIRNRIVERSLATPEMLDKMSRDEIFEFLFLPGFSTRDEVSELSGRGVGLDIVQSMLREVGGAISVRSEADVGVSITMKLPITRSVMKALNVNIDTQPYAFPLALVYRILKVRSEDIKDDNGKRYFCFDGRRAEFVDSSLVLGFEESKILYASEVYVVVISARGTYYGFAVEGLPSESELVVRPIDKRIGKIPCVSAASLNEEGDPVLILDVDDLSVHAERLVSTGRAIVRSPKSAESRVHSRKRILVVDDSATVRETQRKILERAGYDVDMAVDGVDGWNMFRLSDYDLVVSDVDMPRMGGFSLVKKIRTLNRKIPIVIVSYKDRGEDRNRGLSVGANRYLTKSSFQDDTFIKTVHELMSPAVGA